MPQADDEAGVQRRAQAGTLQGGQGGRELAASGQGGPGQLQGTADQQQVDADGGYGQQAAPQPGGGQVWGQQQDQQAFGQPGAGGQQQQGQQQLADETAALLGLQGGLAGLAQFIEQRLQAGLIARPGALQMAPEGQAQGRVGT